MSRFARAACAGPQGASEFSGLTWSNATQTWWAVSPAKHSSNGAVLSEVTTAGFSTAVVLGQIDVPQSSDPEGVVWLGANAFGVVDEATDNIIIFETAVASSAANSMNASYGDRNSTAHAARLLVCRICFLTPLLYRAATC